MCPCELQVKHLVSRDGIQVHWQELSRDATSIKDVEMTSVCMHTAWGDPWYC
jgi:hypothetical protein